MSVPSCGAVNGSGLPCQKRLTHLSDGSWDHGGGHLYASGDTIACIREGHFDPAGLLSGAPVTHLPDLGCPRVDAPPTEGVNL